MFEMAGPLQPPLRIINILVVHLLLIDFCRGQFQLTGPPQPIVATLGDDIILPCHLVPGANVADKTLEWTRPELDPRFVFVWRAGQDLVNLKNPSYKGRTSLYTGELRHGNISLKLSNVKPLDGGRYKCYVPDLNTESFVELVVASRVDSSPTISLSGLDRNKGGVVLQCESAGWYPEPEMFWLDGEGNLLSAGPTETVRGPDDLYTVSSRVTVEKRHSNSFTCRVQQNSTTQTRETLIHVPVDFFEVQSSSSSTTVGLSVSLAVCILVILIVGFYVWRQNKTKTKRSHRDETDEVEKNQESEVLMTESKSREQQRREEAEKRVQILEEELQKKIRELQEEKKRREEEVQRKNQELQEKNDQLTEARKTWQNRVQDKIQDVMGKKDEPNMNLLQERRDKEEALSEVMMLKDHLESKNKEFEKQQDELKQLQGEIQMMETGLQTLMKDLDSDNLKISLTSQPGRSWSGPVRSFSSLSQWPFILRQKFQEKLQKKITENSSSLSQNSTTKPPVSFKVDAQGKYIQLRNTSSKVQQLGGWVLKIQLNDKEPIIHTFEDSIHLKTGQVFTVRDYRSMYCPADLVLENLKSWSYTDMVQVSLIRHPGEIQNYSVYNP